MGLGVLLSIFTLVGWAVGDFLTQRSVRAVGIWKNIFLIAIFGTVIFFPFAYHDLHLLWDWRILLFLGTFSCLGIFSINIAFKAFNVGKLSIVEPIFGLELPLTLVLAVFIWKEKLVPIQLLAISLIFIGIMLAVTVSYKVFLNAKVYAEKGTLFALISALCLAIANFVIGVASQKISPLATFWFNHFFFAIISGIFLWRRGELMIIPSTLTRHYKLLIPMMLLNNLSWLSFSFALSVSPISIVTSITESYIVIAVLLGIFINKEKIRLHQKIGIAIALFGLLALTLL